MCTAALVKQVNWHGPQSGYVYCCTGKEFGPQSGVNMGVSMCTAALVKQVNWHGPQSDWRDPWRRRKTQQPHEAAVGCQQSRLHSAAGIYIYIYIYIYILHAHTRLDANNVDFIPPQVWLVLFILIILIIILHAHTHAGGCQQSRLHSAAGVAHIIFFLFFLNTHAWMPTISTPFRRRCDAIGSARTSSASRTSSADR
jgi:hypothetical protein